MDHFQRQQSVWNLVKEDVPCSELPEVRAALGDTLVDMYTELYAEVEMWEKIWQAIHYSGQGSRPETPAFPLADPPAIKELLKAEIQLLLLTLRERAASHGRDAGEVMAHYSPSVVSYALGSSSAQTRETPDSCYKTLKSPSRPPSSLSEIGSRSFSSLSSHSSYEDEIRALRHKLNVTHIDEVVSHLRSVLTEECEAMKGDVQVLQENIETERASRQRGPLSPEPTVAELKEERRIIQRDLKVQSLMSCSQTTKLQLRETHELDLSANYSERTHQTVPSGISSFHLKPCPPRDKDHIRTAVSSKQRDRLTRRVSPPDTPQRTTPDSCLDLHHSNLNNGQSITSSLKIHTTLTNGNCSNVVFALEHEEKSQECKYRGTSTRSSAFRLESGSTTDLGLQPAPPAGRRTASRGLRANRHLCVPHPDSVM